MQFIYPFLSFILASSLISASPIDRFFRAKRQVVVVTVTSAVTVTVSSTMAQVTTTVTISAAFARPVLVSTTTTDPTDPTDPTTTTTPIPEATASAAPAAAPAPSPATPDPTTNDATSSDSIGTIFSGQGTFYAPGLGSCGVTSEATDLICAIGHTLYDSIPNGDNPNNSPFCGRKIKASTESGSVTVTVVDRCTGCAEYDLDFSPTAFDALGSEVVGRIPITWEFIS